MDDQTIMGLFDGLTKDFDDLAWLAENRPLLAHYTSIATLEKILKSEELWLSNPLFMNDLEEVRFGINQGLRLFQESEIVEQACGSANRADITRKAFIHYFNQFDADHVFDTYVFCLSRHNPENSDGLLSMWRGYGGQGTGAALIFNTNLISATGNPQSPLLISRVRYASAENRVQWMEEKLSEWCHVVSSNDIADDKLYLAAFQFFNLTKYYALVSKHNGFSEEEEWRIIYMPERDLLGLFKSAYDYVIGTRGVEPKLKLKIAPLPFPDAPQAWALYDILDQIILGPSISSPLALRSVIRMLEMIGKPKYQSKVVPSRIPLRSSS